MERIIKKFNSGCGDSQVGVIREVDLIENNILIGDCQVVIAGGGKGYFRVRPRTGSGVNPIRAVPIENIVGI